MNLLGGNDPDVTAALLDDREVAVVLDALADTRARLTELGVATPTIDTALAKIGALVGPDTIGMSLTPIKGEPA